MTKYNFKFMEVGDVLLYRVILLKAQNLVRKAVYRYNRTHPGRLIARAVGGGIEVKRVE